MKVLLDCIVTAANPAQCSSNIQFITFVKRTLATRNDVFFYWLIPDWVDDELFVQAYPQDPRIKYVRVPQHKDRSKEYFTLSRQLDSAAAFNGDFWDYDVLITVRSGLVPALKLIQNSPRAPKMSWLREIWLIEEMPLMSFKNSVLKINPDVQDLYTLTGHLVADRSFILSYHEKPQMVSRARDFFTPTNVRKLDQKIRPVITSQFSDFRLKPESDYPDPANGKPLCVAFSGRIAASSSIEKINDVLVNSFVMKGDKVKLLVTTVSAGIQKLDTSVIDVKQASRDEFWRLCREEMHVIINMATEGGFLLSLIEPMMLGVPSIVIREPWSEALLGQDFPFFVYNEVQAYALVSMFYNDYPVMYGQFAKWFENSFRPLMEQRFQNDLLYDLLDQAVEEYSTMKRKRFAAQYPGKEENAFVRDLLKTVGDRDEFVFKDIVAEMVESKLAEKVMLDKLQEGDRDRRHLAFCTNWNEYRAALQTFHGWEDASAQVGHMKRKSKEA